MSCPFSSKPAEPAPEPAKPALKPCCACPETRKLRDECVFKNGEDECKDAILAHIACMKALGFEINTN